MRGTGEPAAIGGGGRKGSVVPEGQTAIAKQVEGLPEPSGWKRGGKGLTATIESVNKENPLETMLWREIGLTLEGKGSNLTPGAV